MSSNMDYDDVLLMAYTALRLGRTMRATKHDHPFGEYESDTDHTVMLGVIAASWAAKYEPRLDVNLVAAFALVHDYAEAYGGDTNTFGISGDVAALAAKAQRDAESVAAMRRDFEGTWLMVTLERYERQDTPEARFVKLIDKVTPKLTHMLNMCRALREDGRTRNDLIDAHAKQRTLLADKYGREFPGTIALLDWAMDRSVASWPNEETPEEEA